MSIEIIVYLLSQLYVAVMTYLNSERTKGDLTLVLSGLVVNLIIALSTLYFNKQHQKEHDQTRLK